MRLFVRFSLIGLAALSGPRDLAARADPAVICDAAAHQVASETGVPLSVLRAITRTETGRGSGGTLKPWPWTVNMEGKGVWFDTEDEARVYVFRHFKQGARSFDVGCFQINYRWHGQAFNSIEEMFDPLINTRYAANFLRKLHSELGDWTRAAGAYHSRTQKYANRYIARFSEIRGNLSDTPAPERLAEVRRSPDAQTPRVNSFSLLTGGSTSGRMGSLMPVTRRATSLLSPTNGG